jgi:nitrilase
LPGYPVWLDYAPGAALWGNLAIEALFTHLYVHSPSADGSELGELAALAVQHDVFELRANTHANSSVRFAEQDRQV